MLDSIFLLKISSIATDKVICHDRFLNASQKLYPNIEISSHHETRHHAHQMQLEIHASRSTIDPDGSISTGFIELSRSIHVLMKY
jgi:hypothetical protein